MESTSSPQESVSNDREEQLYSGWSVANLVSLFIAMVSSVYIFSVLNWSGSDGEMLLFTDTTPTGGDMGAHIWGAAYMRDELLPKGLLSGWSPDWYAGIPAYQFYMVIPPLMIIALNAEWFSWIDSQLPVWMTPEVPFWVYIPLLIFVCLAVWVVSSEAILRALQFPEPFFRLQKRVISIGRRGGGKVASVGRRSAPHKKILLIAAVLLLVLLIPVPYGVAFKLVSVSGVVLFPLAAWAMGRLARSPEPIPGMLALGALVFQFDTNFRIIGGNILSTLAGEFSFSISLCLLLVSVGLLIRGMQENKWRIRSVVFMALVALTHIIPLFFMVLLSLLILFTVKSASRMWPMTLVVSLGFVAFATGEQRPSHYFVLSVVFLVILVVTAVLVDRGIRSGFFWLAFVGLLSAGLAAFWLVPFLVTGHFQEMFNDMGWTRVDEIRELLLTPPMKIALIGAAVGSVISLAKREILGFVFGSALIISTLLVANLGEGALWNKRLLPFYYLSAYLVCAIGVAYIVRMVATRLERGLQINQSVIAGFSAVAMALVLFGVSVPLHIIPSLDGYRQEVKKNDDGEDETVQVYELFFINSERSPLRGWASWNYEGYERKSSYRDYRNVVLTMDEIGEKYGCGRSMWEFNKDLDTYGTPMALMLLPHWTDGCIGSMEGLYFESSATTPFHFLNQNALSESSSSAQSFLPYDGFDFDKGIAQLQAMGVKYYMAKTDKAIAAARAEASSPATSRLTELADVGSFVIFLVKDTELVEGLENYPVIISEGETYAGSLNPEDIQQKLIEQEEVVRQHLGEKWARKHTKYLRGIQSADTDSFIIEEEIGVEDLQRLDQLKSEIVELVYVESSDAWKQSAASGSLPPSFNSLSGKIAELETVIDEVRESFEPRITDAQKIDAKNGYTRHLEKLIKKIDEQESDLEGDEFSLRQDMEIYRDSLVAAAERSSRFRVGWQGEAIKFYNNPLSYTVLPAVDGPDNWPATDKQSVYLEDTVLPTIESINRSETLSSSAKQESSVLSMVRPVEKPAEIIDGSYEQTTDSISFSVKEPGSPVLVKTSYFPNWNVEGAEGPWRVGANQMVVVPTEKDVTLTYKRSGTDWFSLLISLGSAGALVALYVWGSRQKRLGEGVVSASDGVQVPLSVKSDSDSSSSEEESDQETALIQFEDLPSA